MELTEPYKSPIVDLVGAAFASGGNPKRSPQTEYRYYHCRLDWDGLFCKQVDGPHVMPTQDCTKLLFVKRSIPEQLDKYVLHYKWAPDRVIIEK